MAMTGWHSIIYYYATRFLCSHVDVGTYEIVSETFISFTDLSPVMYSTVVVCDIQKVVVAFYTLHPSQLAGMPSTFTDLRAKLSFGFLPVDVGPFFLCLNYYGDDDGCLQLYN